MKKNEARLRLEKLRKEINDYRYNYHVLNKSTMSEAAADSLKHELTELESQFPDLITPDSPSQRVAGAPLDAFNKVQHSQRMLSLNDVFDFNELKKWFERIEKLQPNWDGEVFVDLKLDGLACALIYEDGILQTAVTRGDGYVGEDVTQNVKTIHTVPLKLRSEVGTEYLKGRLEVRGEIIMLNSDFERLNSEREKEGLEPYANPRNTAAGSIRQLDSSLVAKRALRFHPYALLHSDVKTKQQEYKLIDSLGFISNPVARSCANQQELEKFIDEWEEKRKGLPYNTDGAVITVNDRHVFEELGVVGKAPRGACAFKYPAEQATTKIKDIIISVGRTGTAVPVAIMEPVLIAGSTVQRATLHNEDEIARKDVRIGDTVIIQKAGDIIPEVIRPLVNLRDGSEEPYDMKKALSDHPLEFKRKEGEAAWRTTNLNDPSIFIRSLQHFVSKGAMDIDGMGKKIVELLVNEGLVKDIADLYTLSYEDVLDLEGFAEKSAQQLIDAINEKKQPELARFIFGLGIRHVGQQTALDLAKKFGSFHNFLQATFEELEQIDGVGTVVAHAIEEWLIAEQTQRLLEKLKQLEVWPQDYISRDGVLTGEKVVITGSIPNIGREEGFELVRKNGGEVQSSVSKETTVLVVGEKPGASKRKKAASLGIKEISANEFLEKLNAKS